MSLLSEKVRKIEGGGEGGGRGENIVNRLKQ